MKQNTTLRYNRYPCGCVRRAGVLTKKRNWDNPPEIKYRNMPRKCPTCRWRDRIKAAITKAKFKETQS